MTELVLGVAAIVGERAACHAPEGKKPAHTMPEALALQFFFNEGGGKFARTIAPFNTRLGDKRRLPLVGTDTNSYRRGSFDGVFHKGGDWYTSRGWGMGQATESDGSIDGIRLERGLPIMDPGATEVRHPRSFTDPKASFSEALDGKALAKYDGRTRRHDCSYGRVVGGHCACQAATVGKHRTVWWDSGSVAA